MFSMGQASAKHFTDICPLSKMPGVLPKQTLMFLPLSSKVLHGGA